MHICISMYIYRYDICIRLPSTLLVMHNRQERGVLTPLLIADTPTRVGTF